MRSKRDQATKAFYKAIKDMAKSSTNQFASMLKDLIKDEFETVTTYEETSNKTYFWPCYSTGGFKSIISIK